MIGAAGYYAYKTGKRADLALNAKANEELRQVEERNYYGKGTRNFLENKLDKNDNKKLLLEETIQQFYYYLFNPFVTVYFL